MIQPAVESQVVSVHLRIHDYATGKASEKAVVHTCSSSVSIAELSSCAPLVLLSCGTLVLRYPCCRGQLKHQQHSRCSANGTSVCKPAFRSGTTQNPLAKHAQTQAAPRAPTHPSTIIPASCRSSAAEQVKSYMYVVFFEATGKNYPKKCASIF